MSILFDNIVNISNAEYSYQKCMLGKSKYNRNAILFDMDKTSNINRILDHLKNKTYSPSKYNEFTIYEPKERIIHAPVFSDKLVQRMVYNVLKDIYQPVFIKDSYACIVDRGTHAASERTQHYLRKAKWEYKNNPFIIKIDIKKYFYSINRDVVKKLYRKKIKCEQTLWLLDTIVDSAPNNQGLPLGNITSHTFANIVLNELDQYCKRYLGIKYYIRYMDDICIVVKNKKEAQRILSLCKVFIRERLYLEVNENKTKIFPLAQGVNFVGFKTWPTHKLLRERSKSKIKNRLKKIPRLIKRGDITKNKAEQMLNSWYGHAQKGNYYNLLQVLQVKFPYIYLLDNKIKIAR